MKEVKLEEAAYQFEAKMSLRQAIPLGLQHVCAMFVGNLTPLLIITSACGIAGGEFADLQVTLLQSAMFVAGVVTLVQLFTVGPVGGGVPIIMGTSSGFIGVFNSVVGTMGGGVLAYGAIMGASIIGGIFESVLGFFLKPLRKFFPPVVTGTVVLSIGLSLISVGMLLAVVMSKIFTSFVFKGEDTPFVMELPPYRFPTWKAVGRHTWEKGRQYLKKMGGIILCATIIVWALGYFPHNEQLGEEAQQEQSYIGQIGHAVEPVFTPQGFNWKLDIGLVAGVGAKEVVASTMGVLYSNDSRAFRSELQHDVARQHGLSYDEAGPLTTLTAYCFLLFVLLYFPCIATVAAIKGETGSWRWALFAAGYTTLLAWVVSALVFQLGRLLLV